MTINKNSKNVTRIASDVYQYNGSIKTDDKLIIHVPTGATLVIEGDISSKQDISIHGGSVQVDGNISAQSKIFYEGDLGARKGSIFAPNGIECHGFVCAAKSIYCDNGEINADEGVHADGMVSCTNIDHIPQF